MFKTSLCWKALHRSRTKQLLLYTCTSSFLNLLPIQQRHSLQIRDASFCFLYLLQVSIMPIMGRLRLRRRTVSPSRSRFSIRTPSLGGFSLLPSVVVVVTVHIFNGTFKCSVISVYLDQFCYCCSFGIKHSNEINFWFIPIMTIMTIGP